MTIGEFLERTRGLSDDIKIFMSHTTYEQTCRYPESTFDGFVLDYGGYLVFTKCSCSNFRTPSNTLGYLRHLELAKDAEMFMDSTRDDIKITDMVAAEGRLILGVWSVED